MNRFILSLAVIIIIAPSCSKKKSHVAFYTSDSSEVFDDEFSSSIVDNDNIINGTVEIPFRREGGIKYVSTRINGHPFEMIFDTGCSGVSISASSARYLAELGVLNESDLGGILYAQIADGSLVETQVVNLHELVLADKIRCNNVEATISNSATAPLLLGNEVLDRAYRVTIDNSRDVIIIHTD